MTAAKSRWVLIVSLAFLVLAVGLARTVSAQAEVANADIYEVRWVKACAAGGPNCDFGIRVMKCDAGDELTGGHAYRSFADGTVAANIPYGFKGVPAIGIRANASFVSAGQKAFVIALCANTTP